MGDERIALKFLFDSKFNQLGLREICFAIFSGIDNTGELPDELKTRYHHIVQLVTKKTNVASSAYAVEKGYVELISDLQRSTTKFPPSAVALTNIVQKKGAPIHISPLVDIYNMHSLESRLSIGAHDLDKIHGPITFRIARGNEVFSPIGGGQKKIAAGDFIYADEEHVLAWLDSRDSDQVKLSRTTKKGIFIIQGNRYTNRDYRLEALKNICADVVRACGGSIQAGYVETTSGKINYV